MLAAGGNSMLSAVGARVKRAAAPSTLICTASEACYFVDADAFCFDEKKMLMRDLEVTVNMQTGDYVKADGEKGNIKDLDADSNNSKASVKATASGSKTPGQFFRW